jgi:hypothetical protein
MAVSSPEDSRRLPAAALPSVARFSHAAEIPNTDTPDGRTRARDGEASAVPRRAAFTPALDWRYPLLPGQRARRGGLLGKRRRKDRRKKRTSSADLRFIFVLVVVGGVGLVLWHAAWDASRALVAILGPIILFAAHVYSNVPVQLGGGRPRPILQYTLTGKLPALPPQDHWASVGCRRLATSPPLCRLFYKTHEAAGHFFVVVVDEPPGVCAGAVPEWTSLSLRHAKTACYVRLADDEAKRLELPDSR